MENLPGKAIDAQLVEVQQIVIIDIQKTQRKVDLVKLGKMGKLGMNCKKVNSQTSLISLELLHKLGIDEQQIQDNEKKAREEVVIGGEALFKSRVTGDGNCLFRSLSVLLFDTEIYHKQLRKHIVEHMETEESTYSMYIDTPFKQHTSDMKKTKGGQEIWGTEAEIVAAAHLLEVAIDVYSTTNNITTIQKFGSFSRCKTITLQLSNQHYEPLFETSTRLVNFISNSNDYEPNTQPQHKSSKYLKRTKEKNMPHGSSELYTEEVRQKARDLGMPKTGDDTMKSQDTDKKHSTIFNLSDRKLTENEMALLEKGLTFIPTRARVDMSRLLSDLREWERKMRLREFYYEKEENKPLPGESVQSVTQKIHQKIDARKRNKIWMPPKGRDPCLDLYIDMVKEDIIEGITTDGKGNISVAERVALRDLMLDDSIVIRPADKGSEIVVMNKIDYIDKANEELYKSDTYVETDDETKKVTNDVRRIVKKMFNNGWIDDKVKEYMMPNFPKCGQLKGNPKMHKDNAPLRSIVSTISHPTEKLAEIAEEELNEWVCNLPSFVKDTTDFLQKVAEVNCINNKSLLFTMDVKALYPSVPKQEGLEACREALEMRTNKHIPTEAVMLMIETVLSNNVFKFGNRYFKQTDGTAIGSKLGKNYACTYMGAWEQELLEQCPRKPTLYLQFVDDIFGVWDGTEEELLEFQSIANQIHPRIKVTLNMSRQSIEFLDVTIKMVDGAVNTTIYEKPSDKHMYLHQKSSHPNTTKKAIPFGLGIRARRICSTEKEYKINRKKIVDNLGKRGYKKKQTSRILRKVDGMDRKQLLQYNDQKHEDQDRVPLVITYGNNLPDIQGIMHNRLKVMHRSAKMKEVFKEAPLTAFRRDANIQDILVHVKHRRLFDSSKEGTHPCGQTCAICTHMADKIEYTSGKGRQFTFKDPIDCKTNNLVYGIYCKECDRMVYVGETGTTLYTRFQNQLSAIRKGADDPVPRHFASNNHRIDDLKIVGIEKIKSNDIHYRKIRESFWIKKMGTLKPNGINQNLGIGDGDRECNKC